MLPARTPLAAALLSLWSILSTLSVCGQAAPVIKRVSPIGVTPGESVAVTVTGSNLTGVRELWTSIGRFPLTSGIENNGELKDRVTFQCNLPAEAPLGLQTLRVVSAGGVSTQRLWMVDDLPTVPLAGGNTSREAAQAVPFPCTIDGVMGNLQRRFFRFEVSQGQRVAIDLFARRLGSSLDPLVILYSQEGRQLASADDLPGLGGDCQLVHVCDTPGAYVIELRDIRYRGGDDYPFRLRLGDLPCVQSSYPTAVQRGTTTDVHLSGLDVAGIAAASADVPADWPRPYVAVAARSVEGNAAAFATIPVTNRPQLLEEEPNNTTEQATPLVVDQDINGRLNEPGDVDCYRVSVEKETRLVLRGVTRQEGSPADLTLRLLDAEGKQLATADDDGVNEGRLDYTFKAAGEYVLEVADLVHRGGPAFTYRVEVSTWRPSFDLAVEGDGLSVPVGGTAILPVVATRRGYNGAISLQIDGLPDAVQAMPTTIGSGQTRGHISLTLPDSDATLDLTNVEVFGTADVGGDVLRVNASSTDWLRGKWNNLAVVPLIAQRSLMAQSVPAGKIALLIEPAEVVFGPDLKAHVNVRVRRADGLDGDVALATNPAKDALPKEISLQVKPIPKNADSVALQFSGTSKAPLGPFSIVLTGTLKKDKQTLTASTPVINYRLEPAITLTATPAEGALKIGGELALSIRVQRNPAYSGPVTVKAVGLPAGVSFPDVTIPADASEVQAKLLASADVAAGPLKGAKLKATAGDKGSLTAEIALPELAVQ